MHIALDMMSKEYGSLTRTSCGLCMGLLTLIRTLRFTGATWWIMNKVTDISPIPYLAQPRLDLMICLPEPQRTTG